MKTTAAANALDWFSLPYANSPDASGADSDTEPSHYVLADMPAAKPIAKPVMPKFRPMGGRK